MYNEPIQNEQSSYKERFSRNIKIKDITETDSLLLQQAIEIYDISLGENYISKEELLKYAADPKRFILIGATIDQTLYGVMLAYPLDKGSREKRTLEQHNIPINLQDQTIGLIKSVAVKPEYRQAGIGTKLIRESMTRLSEMNCNLFLAVSWVSNRPDSSGKMLEQLGFENILSVPDYWTKDSIEEGYSCPNCGNPCHCTAKFYLHKPK